MVELITLRLWGFCGNIILHCTSLESMFQLYCPNFCVFFNLACQIWRWARPTYQVSKERAQTLGITFVAWELSLKDTIESLKETGLPPFLTNPTATGRNCFWSLSIIQVMGQLNNKKIAVITWPHKIAQRILGEIYYN